MWTYPAGSIRGTWNRPECHLQDLATIQDDGNLLIQQFQGRPCTEAWGPIGLYARRPVKCVPLTATHSRLPLSWSRKRALWTPQQWSCVMFSDELRFSL
ncbi:HTH_Tnp_Tc3_2 domain-containing protein [Trichonephila clavipes]|nr:HTH_Tnp_Tc3_2 domain-containing protein [Trichonephila clavipes]